MGDGEWWTERTVNSVRLHRLIKAGLRPLPAQAISDKPRGQRSKNGGASLVVEYHRFKYYFLLILIYSKASIFTVFVPVF